MPDTPLQYLGIDWLAMVLTFTALWLLGNKQRLGFVIMMMGTVEALKSISKPLS